MWLTFLTATTDELLFTSRGPGEARLKVVSTIRSPDHRPSKKKPRQLKHGHGAPRPWPNPTWPPAAQSKQTGRGGSGGGGGRRQQVMQMKLAFDRRESVESLGAGDGSRKLTPQMRAPSSGAACFRCCRREAGRDGTALPWMKSAA